MSSGIATAEIQLFLRKIVVIGGISAVAFKEFSYMQRLAFPERLTK
jgi:hypothetical protein